MMKVGMQYKSGTIVSIVGTSVTWTVKVDGENYKHMFNEYVSREDQENYEIYTAAEMNELRLELS